MADGEKAAGPGGGTGQTIGEWLGLTEADHEAIEFARKLARAIRDRREAAGLTQAEFAARIGSRQSVVAKAEHGQVSISKQLAILFASGTKAADLSIAGV